MAESIDILIAADDKASAKLKSVGGAVDDLGKRVKETGQKTKASVELVGTFAKTLGNSPLGAYAGELGQLTERISAFSEVAKGGGAGAMVFKAGLAAAVAVASFKLGETIGGWAFQTDKWAKSMEEAAAKAAKLNQLQQASQQKQFANIREDIGLIADPAERAAALQERQKELMAEKAGVEQQIKASERLLESSKRQRDAWSLGATLRRGEKQAQVKLNEEQVAQDRQRLEALNAEWKLVSELNGERAKDIEARKAANEANAKSQSFIDGLREEVAVMKATTDERLKMEAAKNTTPAQRGEAEQLLKEREALKAKAEAEKEAQQAAEQARLKQLAEAEKIQDLQTRELAKLEEKRILLTQGAEAARAFALEQQGLSSEFAKSVAAQEAALNAKDDGKKFEADLQPQQAVQSRLLTRGSGGDPAAQMAQNTAKIAQGTAEQLRALQDLVKKQEQVINAIRGNKVEIKSVNVP